MTFRFKPAAEFVDRHGLFVALIGSTNSGKTYSALRLGRGIAGPKGKLAVADTEGGRTLHLRKDFAFDAVMMDPPFRPARFAEVAKDAEEAGYDALVIDSFSMEWVGLGGVLDWQEAEFKRMGSKDSARGASWIEPKRAHKAMVYALLQRRIPIIFSIRGEETFVPPSTKLFKPITNKAFPFEVTVSFRLESDRKGYVDLSDPKSWKMEGAHAAIFKHGDLISEDHGAALAAWARGAVAAPPPAKSLKEQLFDEAREKMRASPDEFDRWHRDLPPKAHRALAEIGHELAELRESHSPAGRFDDLPDDLGEESQLPADERVAEGV